MFWDDDDIMLLTIHHHCHYCRLHEGLAHQYPCLSMLLVVRTSEDDSYVIVSLSLAHSRALSLARYMHRTCITNPRHSPPLR